MYTPAKFWPAVAATFVLVVLIIACGGSRPATETIHRGELTINTYAPKPGIGHGDGTPGGCTFSFKGTEYKTPPGVENGGRMFRCDVKEDSDEAVIRVAYYRPEDDWTCGTRFGAEQAKCLPDNYKPVGGIVWIKNGELAFEDHGFWDVSYDWGDHSIKFADGRIFDYASGKWSGCGPEPLKFVKSGSLVVASGQFCNSNDWSRIYFSGKELRPDGAGDHPFDSVGINQDATVPSATAWIGSIRGFVYLASGKPVYKEVGNSPEFFDDGKQAQWWSEDYQTRYRMVMTTGAITQQTRAEVGAALDISVAEKNEKKQITPLFTSDDFGKFEVDYKDHHGQFYLNDLKRFDPLNDIGWYPYNGKLLLSSGTGEASYFVFEMHNVIETPKIDDPCIGQFVTSIIWAKTDEQMILRDGHSQVVSSCLLGRKLIGEPKIVNGKLTVAFEDAAGKHNVFYDNASPASAMKLE